MGKCAVHGGKSVSFVMCRWKNTGLEAYAGEICWLQHSRTGYGEGRYLLQSENETCHLGWNSGWSMLHKPGYKPTLCRLCNVMRGRFTFMDDNARTHLARIMRNRLQQVVIQSMDLQSLSRPQSHPACMGLARKMAKGPTSPTHHHGLTPTNARPGMEWHTPIRYSATCDQHGTSLSGLSAS